MVFILLILVFLSIISLVLAFVFLNPSFIILSIFFFAAVFCLVLGSDSDNRAHTLSTELSKYGFTPTQDFRQIVLSNDSVAFKNNGQWVILKYSDIEYCKASVTTNSHTKYVFLPEGKRNGKVTNVYPHLIIKCVDYKEYYIHFGPSGYHLRKDQILYKRIIDNLYAAEKALNNALSGSSSISSQPRNTSWYKP